MSTEIISTVSALHGLMNDPTREVVNIEIVNAETLLVSSRVVSGALQPLPTSAIPYAIYTTAHARCQLFNAISNIPEPEENLLYMGLSIKFVGTKVFRHGFHDICGETRQRKSAAEPVWKFSGSAYRRVEGRDASIRHHRCQELFLQRRRAIVSLVPTTHQSQGESKRIRDDG